MCIKSVACCRSETQDLRTCIDALSCSESESDRGVYVVHQRVVGISIGDQYLCSDTARPGATKSLCV